MLNKYITVIDFYQESRQDDQVKLAKEEYLKHKKTVSVFNFFWNMKLKDIQEDPLFQDVCKKLE